jgi:hypothetical protein
MTAPVFAPLAAIEAFLVPAAAVRSLAPPCVLGGRAVRSGVVGSGGEGTLTSVAAAVAKLAGWGIAAAGVRSGAAAHASAPGKTPPLSGADGARCGPALWTGADGRYVQRRSPRRAPEPWRLSA